MSNVREQYEHWTYPTPVQDLDQDFQEGVFDLSDPSLFRRKLWPRAVEPDKLRILVAGCGTMQAARLAHRNRDCEVVGVDISQASLAHQDFLKQKHRLDNLQLHCLGLLELDKLGQPFDLIISTGVLHHLPDPDAGLRQLKAVLAPHGVMSLMVYGWYARFGVYMMQEVFRLLGVEQTRAGVEMVRETINALPAWHHVTAFVRMTPDLKTDDNEVVDVFLHPCDRAFAVPQLLRFASDNGLRFQDWLDRHDYSVSANIPEVLAIYPRAVQLQTEQQWHLIELLGQRLACHRFLFCRPERNPADYTLDFTTPGAQEAWLSYVPQLRWPIDVQTPGGWVSYNPKRQPSVLQAGSPATLRRYTHAFNLSGPEVSLFARVNGTATIGEIIQAASSHAGQLEENRGIAFRLFARMHDWDHLLFQI